MDVGVLGPLRVWGERGEIRVGGARLRALLALLALEAGRPVAVESLIGALWPEEAPAHPRNALELLVSRLRRALGGASAVRSGDGWYRLDVEPDAVDAHRFEQLAMGGRDSMRAGRMGEARRLLREALGLWRGEALIDVGDVPRAAAAAVRLEELRLVATEDRIEADLAVEPGPALVAELEGLVTANPLRERLRSLLMRALQAEGRRAEALTAYEDARRLLAEELGSDPGRELQETHRSVLRGETPERLELRGNLPSPATAFFGREIELAHLDAQLRAGRLVTLVGPGGAGKTRLATTFAGRAAGSLVGGTWLVELAAVSDARDVPERVLAVLGRPEIGSRGHAASTGDRVRRLIDVLSAAETLLVLDNCEHVLDAAGRLAEVLLAHCPRLRVLATSRERLGIAAERLCPVAPLPLPAAGDASVSAAVRLFIDRARAVRPDFEADDVALARIADVCRRLDGLPLAIELAAARLRSMSLRELAAGLDDRFRLLTDGIRTAPERQRTLRATVTWSWGLLDGAERARLARLAAFPASFGGDAAERVGVPWETLQALVDKSLLQVVEGRYVMLETIRAYARERLQKEGLAGAARAAHATCYLEVAERAAPHLRGAGQPPWIGTLARERENLLAALRYAVEARDAATATRLAAACAHFWAIVDGHAALADRLHQVLRVTGPAPAEAAAEVAGAYLLYATLSGASRDVPAAIRRCSGVRAPDAVLVRALGALARGDLADGLAELRRRSPPRDPWRRGRFLLIRSLLHGGGGDLQAMCRDLARAADAFRGAGERWGLSLTLTYLALAPGTELAAACASLEEAVGLIRELGGDARFQRAWLARLHGRQGDEPRAMRELVEIAGEATSGESAALARILLADLARRAGDLDTAAAHLEGAAAHDAGETFAGTLLRLQRARLGLQRGELGQARRDLRTVLSEAAAMPDLPFVATVGIAVAELSLRGDQPEHAAFVLGAADAVRGRADEEDPDVAQLRAELSSALGAGAFARARRHGRSLGREAALAAIEHRLRAGA
jgi:predicted ATPase/DNA-binding SARP family transcriptional activator